MGKRREPRTEIELPVRIFGTDAAGRAFSENVLTVDVSRTGAKLKGVQAQLKSGELIGLTHGPNKGRFYVKWVGQPGTPRAGQIGLMSASPEKTLWEVALPPPTSDPFQRQSASDRREHP